MDRHQILTELGQITADLNQIRTRTQLAALAARLQAVSASAGVALQDTDERVPVLEEKLADSQRRLGFDKDERGARMFAGVATFSIGQERDGILHLLINCCAGLADIPFTVNTVVAEVLDGDLHITMEVEVA